MSERLPSGGRPIVVTGGDSAASASRPDTELDVRYHAYESNPVPWWLSIVWLCFLVFGFVYLVVNLLE
jgi:hypothetical protein